MATFEKRKTSKGETKWRAKVRRVGSPTTTATFNSLNAAKKWARFIEDEIVMGRHGLTQKVSNKTFSEALERYIKEVLPEKSLGMQRDQERQLGVIGDILGNPYPLQNIDYNCLIDLREKVIAQIKPRGNTGPHATCNRYFAALSHLLSQAVLWGYITSNPCSSLKNLKEPPGRDRFLTNEEIKQLLEACKSNSWKDLYPLVFFALNTGSRRGEIFRLMKKDVLFDKSMAILRETKNGEIRTVPLRKDLKEELQRSFLEHPNNPLAFPRPSDGKQLKDVDYWFSKALEVAEIKDFTFHDLRHSAASYLAMSGASTTTIGTILGHKDPKTTKRYTHLTNGHLVEAVEQMNTLPGSDSDHCGWTNEEIGIFMKNN